MYFRMGAAMNRKGEYTEITLGAGIPFLAAAQTVIPSEKDIKHQSSKVGMAEAIAVQASSSSRITGNSEVIPNESCRPEDPEAGASLSADVS
jgi:hypothetical protein